MAARDQEWSRIQTSDDMRQIGIKGGQSRSEAKRAAARENQKKAVEARKRKRLGFQVGQ